MGKLKGFYQNNRVYCILMAVSIFCLALIAAAVVFYFINQTKNDVYGNRLNGIESVTITNEHKNEIIDYIKENEKVESVVLNVKGKIIYISIFLTDGKYEDAQNIAIKSLDKLTEDEKNYYDINFIFDRNSEENTIFPIMGYKKSDATIITWTKENGEA